jgi:hypothetical protein
VEVNRSEFLSLLKTVAPALASGRTQLPELSCIWFDGRFVSAFNDVIGVRVRFKTDFTGGFIGSKFIGVLDASTDEMVQLSLDDDDLLIELGNARVKLVRRPIEDWFWSPEVPQEPGFKADKTFMEYISLLLISVGAPNVVSAEQRGITIIQKRDVFDLYSTDALTMSWIQVEGGEPLLNTADRTIIPTLFCECLVSTQHECELKFDQNAVYCVTQTDVGENQIDMLLFSKLVDDDSPVPFEDVVRDCVGNDPQFPVPAELKICTDRAMVLLNNEPAELEVKQGHLLLYARTSYGEVDDAIKIGKASEVKVKIDVALLRRALEGRERMTVSDSCIVVFGPGSFKHIISNK